VRASAAEPGPAQLGQAPPGHKPELGGQVLDQHRGEAGEDDDPDELVTACRSPGEVSSEVTRVHVGDGGDEGGPQEAGREPHATSGAQLPDREPLGLRARIEV
jgi:hypothetical protein